MVNRLEGMFSQPEPNDNGPDLPDLPDYANPRDNSALPNVTMLSLNDDDLELLLVAWGAFIAVFTGRPEITFATAAAYSDPESQAKAKALTARLRPLLDPLGERKYPRDSDA